jgi:hypothetical protein
MKIVNQTPVPLTVPGYGQVQPGGELEVPETVARHLLACDAWTEPKPSPKSPPADDRAAQVKE